MSEQVQVVQDELQLVQTFRWPEGLVTSCYLHVDGRQWPNRGNIASMVNSLVSQAKADLERRQAPHAVRASVRNDFEALDAWVRQHLPERSGNQTLAWFHCSAHGIQVARWLPVPLPNRIVLADNFDDSAMFGVIRSVPRVGLVLIDHAVTRFYHADVSQVVEAAAFEPEYQEKIRARETTFGRKTMMPDAMFGRGNLHEKRLQNRRDHLLHRHVDQIVPRLSRIARENGWGHLLVAGETRSVSAFRNRLTTDLRRLDVQVVDLPVKSDATAVRTFLRSKMDELRQERFHQEYRIITDQTLPEMRAQGLREVCRAAALNAIQLLLMEAAPPHEGLVCEHCGWLGVGSVGQCPVCQSGVGRTPHMHDALADAVLAAGGDVLFNEKLVLPPHMEHVIARLRFPLNGGL